MNIFLLHIGNSNSLLKAFRPILEILFIMILLSCTPKSHITNKVGIDPAEFNALVEGKTVTLLVLKNTNGLEVTVTNYGAKIVSFLVPDINNVLENIVLGYDNLKDYMASNNHYIGSPIGRYANRINTGTFQLNGTTYTLTINEGTNHLNGGIKGLHSVVWDAQQYCSTPLHL